MEYLEGVDLVGQGVRIVVLVVITTNTPSTTTNSTITTTSPSNIDVVTKGCSFCHNNYFFCF